MKNYGVKILAVATLSVLMLGGCASGALGKLVTPNTVIISQLTFDVAVGAVCGSDTVVGRSKAASIKLVASQLLAVDQGSMVPLSALESTLQAKLATMKLPPADLMAVQELVTVVNQTISNLTQQPATPTSSSTAPSTVPPTQMTAQVAVSTVLQQIINAASAYGV